MAPHRRVQSRHSPKGPQAHQRAVRAIRPVLLPTSDGRLGRHAFHDEGLIPESLKVEKQPPEFNRCSRHRLRSVVQCQRQPSRHSSICRMLQRRPAYLMVRAAQHRNSPTQMPRERAIQQALVAFEVCTRHLNDVSCFGSSLFP
jgi:hypothetical protein